MVAGTARTNRKGDGPPPAALLLALGALAIGLGACDTAPQAAAPPASATAAPGSVQLSAHDWLALGPYGVGNLGCGSGVLAWTTSTQPISKLNHRNDVVALADQNGGPPRIVARSSHGGTLTSAVPITGSWLVYLEYQQHGQTSRADFWYLAAVNWSDGDVRALAQATAGPPLAELPRYAAGGGRAVWSQLDSSGRAILRGYDFGTGQAGTLPLPAGMYPVQPAASSDGVVFVDNSTDPDRAREDFFGRRGTLRQVDLATLRLTTLSADPTAWMPQTAGGVVVWTVVSASSPAVVSALRLPGGPVQSLGANPVTPQTNGALVVWYDSAARQFVAYELTRNRLVRLQVGTWPDVRSVFALCGDRLYFALPPASDGGTSTIRYVDLHGVG